MRLTLRYPFAIPFGHLLDAFGYSEVTDDASTKAVVFQPGTRTDANAESRSALARLAGEQAALKRVATLVARGTPSEQVFAAVTEEVGRLLSADMTHMCRYEPGNTMTFVATWAKGDEGFRLGSRWPLGGQNLATLVFETGRSVRIDNYAGASGPLSVTAQDTGIRSAVGEPDHRRGPALGNDGSRLEHRADPPAGLRGTPGFLHRACGDGDRECRKPRRAESLEGPDHHRY